jgi:hypothetical protein
MASLADALAEIMLCCAPAFVLGLCWFVHSRRRRKALRFLREAHRLTAARMAAIERSHALRLRMLTTAAHRVERTLRHLDGALGATAPLASADDLRRLTAGAARGCATVLALSGPRRTSLPGEPPATLTALLGDAIAERDRGRVEVGSLPALCVVARPVPILGTCWPS